MDDKEILDCFLKLVEEDSNLSLGVAAIRTLMNVIEHSKAETMSGVRENLTHAINVMKTCDRPIAAINSAGELFMRYVTMGDVINPNIEECKKNMLNRGRIYLNKAETARDKVCVHAKDFITAKAKILTHSRSRVVLQALIEASKGQNQFEVFVTNSAPDNCGELMVKELTTAGIKATLILDSAVGYIMEQITCVFVGAEGVVASGGIVNKIGTYTLALCAKKYGKPFYVLAESFKFSRLFPLNNRDLPDEYKYTHSTLKGGNLEFKHPVVDYTSPKYITLFFTDLGVMTPAHIGSFLIKLYL